VRRVQDVVVHAADGRLRDDATLLTVRVLGPGEASRPAEG
jgi:hypothetical protein